MCGEPVGDNGFPTIRSEAVCDEGEAALTSQGGKVRSSNLDCRIKLCVRKDGIGVLQRLEDRPWSEVGIVIRSAVNYAEVVVLVAVCSSREQPDKGLYSRRQVIHESAGDRFRLHGFV